MNKTCEKLQQLMADAMVMFAKVHNYHWNVRGPQFFGVHAKTEEIYENFAVIYDDLAERLLQLGERPLVTLKDVLAKTKIKEETETRFTAEYVINALLQDYKYFLQQFRELSQLSEQDKTTQAYADEKVASLEKEIWMLTSNLNS